MKDDLGDRMKNYERSRTSERLSNDHPFVYARIDGRGFSKFTKGMQKPFDNSMKDMMVSTTEILVKKTHAICGFTQSDEISLVWDAEKLFFGRKIQKISSVLAGLATSAFIISGLKTEHYSRIVDRHPHFDCRIFEIPSEDEVANAFLWRYNDCKRNAIQSISQANFSQKKLNGKSIKEQLAMLASIGVFKEDFPQNSIHGTFVKRIEKEIETDHGFVLRDRHEYVSTDFSSLDHENRKGFILNNESK